MNKRKHDFSEMFTTETWQVNEACMGFRVYEMAGYGSEVANTPYYQDRTDPSGVDTTEDLTKAVVFIDGYVKWDGCINYMFPHQDACMMHDCGNPGGKLKAVMDSLYESAAEYMPKHRSELLEDIPIQRPPLPSNIDEIVRDKVGPSPYEQLTANEDDEPELIDPHGYEGTWQAPKITWHHLSAPCGKRQPTEPRTYDWASVDCPGCLKARPAGAK